MSIPTGTDWINRRTDGMHKGISRGLFSPSPPASMIEDLARIGEARRVLGTRPLDQRYHILEDRWDDGADIITMIAPWWWCVWTLEGVSLSNTRPRPLPYC